MDVKVINIKLFTSSRLSMSILLQSLRSSPVMAMTPPFLMWLLLTSAAMQCGGLFLFPTMTFTPTDTIGQPLSSFRE